jgi:hypothetical protein
MRRLRHPKQKPYRVRRETIDDDVLEDWMCAGAPMA